MNIFGCIYNCLRLKFTTLQLRGFFVLLKPKRHLQLSCDVARNKRNKTVAKHNQLKIQTITTMTKILYLWILLGVVASALTLRGASEKGSYHMKF
jgi:hypothetical protein